jgi:hypothetical protein
VGINKQEDMPRSAFTAITVLLQHKHATCDYHKLHFFLFFEEAVEAFFTFFFRLDAASSRHSSVTS